MYHLGFELKSHANLKMLTNEVLKSSAIEGDHLNRDEVRSSLARRLGMTLEGLVHSGRDVEGVVEMILDATQNCGQPLTKERLCAWHNSLFPTGRTGMTRIVVGEWRGDSSGAMQVVSGPIGQETVHFEAPHAQRLDREMRDFLEWFERAEMDPVLKAGVAHFWFVTIHPFEDGNGRIARAIADLALARADGISYRFYSLSPQIESDRKRYYEQLERQQRGTLDITRWLEWFLTCFYEALISAEETLQGVLFRSKFWEKMTSFTVNERQRHVLRLMLEEEFLGHMNTAKYAKLAKCSTDTALRDIQDLVKSNILIQNPTKGRSTSYRIADKE